MDRDNIFAFEYAVDVFNEIIRSKKGKGYPTYQIIWKTNLGLATANAVHYNQYNYPIIFESDSEADTKIYQPQDEKDLFAVVRHNVFDYFFMEEFKEILHTSLMTKPEMLLDKLLELSSQNISDELETPNYSSLRNFKTLDKLVDLPFITSEAAKIENIASLVSKS